MMTSPAMPAATLRQAASSAAITAVACTHCQLPVPPGLITPHSQEQFCCQGCRTVWQLLHAEGLEQFYAICSLSASKPSRAQAIQDDYTEFDDPGFIASYVKDLGHGIKEVQLLLESVHCAACVWLIEKLNTLCPGVIESRVQLLGRQATIRWDTRQVKLSSIAIKLAQLGYPPHPASDERRASLSRHEMRQHLLKLGVAGLCAGNAMLLAFALYGGLFDGISTEHANILRWTSAALGIISLSWPGSTFFRGAWSALKTRTPHMDVGLSLGLAAGGIMGLYNTIMGTGEIYFDSLCMLVFVLLIGRFLQYRQQQQAAESLSLLRSLTPRVANRVQPDGTTLRVPTSSLLPGNEVDVRIGELIPADGVILQGTSTLDQSLLTGESAGVPVKVGDIVTAGANNLSGVLRVRVAAIGKSSRIGKLMELVESATLSHTPIIELANRISGYFFFIVIGLATITLFSWLSSGVELAINHVIALLIVACPCALGLATPMTIAISQGRAARQKILIRRGDVFEILSKPGLLWLDKTGTLTQGKVTLHAWLGDESVIPQVVALEEGIIHPLASSLITALKERAVNSRRTPVVTDQTYLPGLGVQGIVGGIPCHVGSRAFMLKYGIDMTAELSWNLQDHLSQGCSIIYIACAGRLVAAAAMGDVLRDDALQSIRTLRNMGWKVGILSGDHRIVVDRIAQSLEIPPDSVHAQVLPEEKLRMIEMSRQTNSMVVMVGDGINDAAALAAASVGIAVHGGAEVALQAAPVYLGQPGLRALVELLQGSRRTMQAIRLGLVVSLGYNLTAITLAMLGIITPLLAAILMPISSLTVTVLAMCQRTFRSNL